MKRRISLRPLIAILLISTMALSGSYIASVDASPQSDQALSQWSRDPESGCFVYYENNGEAACRPATEDEARVLSERDNAPPLKVIGGEDYRLQAAAMLNIVLRGTPQLDGFPQAKDAFLRAAARWSALAQANITVVIDVDFGPTRFGTPFPRGVLGSADSQQLGRDDAYAEVRAALIAGAGAAEELALYNSLPQGTVTTDIGKTARVFAPSAALRALGLIASVADPQGEQGQFGPPPSIGFNSGFDFDFDPSDGIAQGQIDFEAVAAHEIGHALAFTSLVGAKELNPDRDVALSVWDIFRFRQGEAMAAAFVQASFTDAQRILSSGGEQVFFAGREQLPLSTGRPDGSGGDGFQASHWKDDRLAGRIIGIMDPVTAAGERGVIVDDDVAVLNAIGYGASVADAGAPTISSVSYDGSTLAIKGKGITGALQLEINFETVAPPLKVKPKASGKKAKVKGTQEQLNLQSGSNRVRLIKDGLRSNVALLDL